MARKPFKGTVADNVLEYGVGGLNIDGTRIETTDNLNGGGYGGNNVGVATYALGDGRKTLPTNKLTKDDFVQPEGRWPANVIMDEEGDEDWKRYFYCPKANKKDRDEGCENLEAKEIAGKGNGLARSCETCGANTMDGCDCEDRTFSNPKRTNHHPTVKPTELMRYLVRLVTPKDGTVLDPFMGSGSTGKACILENKGFIGIELSEDYINIAKSRIENAITKIE
jgi:site-specific DNA-methyltransferase (adenine-specific)